MDTILPDPTIRALKAKYQQRHPNASQIRVHNVYADRYRVNVYETVDGVVRTQKMVDSEFVIAS